MSSSRIKPLTTTKSFNDQQFNDAWEVIAQGIWNVLHKNLLDVLPGDLYRRVYNIILHKNGDKLYQGVRDIITQHLEAVARDQIAPALGVGARLRPEASEVRRQMAWEDYLTAIRLVGDILLYMVCGFFIPFADCLLLFINCDRVYTKVANVPKVYQLGLDLFRDTVVRSPRFPVQQHLHQIMLEQIQKEREGKIIDRGAIKSAVGMLLALTDVSQNNSLYVVDFEEHYLKTSAAFYKVESQMLLANCDSAEYMEKVLKRLNEEQERTRQYLPETTEPKIRNIIQVEMITNHGKTMEMEISGLTQA
ncbi:Cullin repeat-like-containing domain protein [Jimgerdemannia flammicorona]|uniref:Cullin repeat-like-containing domain protein n=1 Tax=Jimgerdemannia flammicorona TaxID=994334 RepID=A0A433Q8I1_9FUNG|nr:Cullin repeat-like-containing domain protein [Jimgerdemannia flammicorona]